MSAVHISGESDEEFARRLQAEEMGITLNISLTQSPGRRGNGPADSNTPLMNGQGDNILIFRPAAPGNNQTVINASLNELATSRATVIALLVLNMPQVIAAIAILSANWDSTLVCDQENRNKWNWWALISASRMFLYTTIVTFMHFFKNVIEAHGFLPQITNIRNIVDVTGLIW